MCIFLLLAPAAIADSQAAAQAVIASAEDRNPEAVKQLTADAAARDKDCPVPNALIKACLDGDFETVRLLLDGGANINGQGCEKYQNSSPLYAAAQTGNVELAKLLMDRGADVN